MERVRQKPESAVEALRQSEERYRLVSEVTSEYAYALRVETNNGLVCEWATESFQRLTGFSVDEINVRGWGALYHPDDADLVSRHHEALFSNQPDSVEARMVTQGGEVRWVRAYARPILDEKEGRIARIYGASQDVTTHRNLEQQLVQSQKMEAIGRLAGGVAHDFNNLLTVITGYARLLERQMAAGNPSGENLEPILTAANRASQLTRQLLAFSRRQVFQLKPVKLNAVVVEIEKMLERMTGEHIQLRTALHPELGLVQADSSQMAQIIMNLALNARDAMPQGGVLTIETANVDFDKYAKEGEGQPASTSVMLSVSDTGTGMTKEVQARIFEPFFTTKEVGKGTGLGLATVYGIVKQTGGEISVQSELGRGTTFKVYLPRLKGEVSTREPASLTQTPPARGTETVLVVEDETALRKLVVKVLTNNGYTVLHAGNGIEALRLVTTYPAQIDLLLTDVVMPELSGPQLVAEMVQLRPDIKVLYMSGYTEDTSAIWSDVSKTGATLIEKPFTPEALLRRSREVLRGESPNPGSVRRQRPLEHSL